MASLRDAVKVYQDELRAGIAWIAFWREGRSWSSDYLYLEMDDTLTPEDRSRLQEIQQTDPAAVVLNGYYCGYLGEDMNLTELTAGVRRHYENGYNNIADFIEAHDNALSPEQIEEAREAAHAAGLPFSEKPYREGDFDPYVFDGSMSAEDYELMHRMMSEERSERLSEIFSILIDNRSRFEAGELSSAWLSMPATVEQLHAAMQSVGITADNPQDFFINGYSYPIDKPLALPYDMVRAAGIDELNFLAARLEALTPADLDALNAAAQRKKGFENIGQIIDYTYNPDFFVHIPGVQTVRDLGDYYLNKSGMVDMPEEWKKGIDLAAFGRNAAEQERGSFTPYGYIVESGDKWERHYEGRDVPEEYRIMSYPQPPARPDPEKADFDAISTGQAATLTAEPPQPRPVVPIVLTSEKPTEKIKEITDRLEQGIAELFDSERYKDYLRVMSKFHNYSFRNTLLIAMQAPDASLVAGFNTWKNTHGRNVKRGEKGIKIFAPSPYKVKREVEKLDPQTRKPIIGKDGKPVTEEQEITVPAYKVVSVFDVSQTEGRELPDIAVDELTGDVDRYNDFFAALEQTSPVPVGFENIEGKSHGYYHLEEKRIAIQEGMSELQTLKTAIHEIAHAKLHDIDLNAPKEDLADRPDRRTREVQAESVAYTVCQHYGLDTSDYSFGYVAGWSSGRELAELKASLETIRTTAAEIIDSIDGHFAELQQAREQAAQQEQPQPGFEQWSEPATPDNLPDNPGEPSDDVAAYLPEQDKPPQEAAPDLAAEPTVTIIWSESAGLREGETMPLSRANALFASLDEAELASPGYDKTKFAIDCVFDGEADHYEGRQDLGDGDGSLIDHIEKYHAHYENNADWENHLLHTEGKEALEADKEQRAMLLHEFVPYLKLHCALSEMEQAATAAMQSGDSLTPPETAYHTAVQAYVAECRGKLNSGDYELPPAPRLADFDPELQAYKEHVREEIAQEAAAAGMTVEEYAAKGYEPYPAAEGQPQEPETPVFDKLPPEQQQELSSEVKATLQMLIDADIQTAGEVTAETLETIATQGYAYRDGNLVKQDAPAAEAPTPEQAAAKPEASVTYYPINEAAARRAKEMNSFDSYKPGSATAAYRSYIDEAIQIAERQKARVDPMYHEKIDSLLDTYARKLAANLNASYAIETRVPSILITGGSNFPVRQKEKQNAARDRNMEEWRDIQGLLDKIRSTGMGGISADDPQAVPKLESKLVGLEKLQEKMKAVNAYFRKHKTLDGCPGLSPEQGQKLVAGMASYDRVPYPSWALSNNSAEIRRLKTRIASLTQQKTIGFVGWEFDGGKVEANTDANRLQIFFDGKPDEATREELKHNGFRWSPKEGAWQRQLTTNAYYAADYVKAIAPITGEKPTELQRAHIRAQKQQAVQTPQEQPAAEAPAPEQAQPQTQDTFSIYQLKRGDETRDFRFEPYDRLQAAGLAVDPANYDLIYTAPLAPDMSLDDIFTCFNIDHPADFKGHSLSVSDVVVLHQAGQDTAHYVDSIGYQQVPEFLREQQELTPDARMTGEQIRTPRGSFHVTDMTREQMEAAGYGFHHQSEDGKYFIMGNGTRAFAVAATQPESPIKHIEDAVEQNDNSFDGIINNTPPPPTVDELEAKVQAGEQISLLDLADAIKADSERGGRMPEKKPSIRAQLKADKERAAQKKTAAKTKSQDLERS